jgi:hypothetical protein
MKTLTKDTGGKFVEGRLWIAVCDYQLAWKRERPLSPQSRKQFQQISGGFEIDII